MASALVPLLSACSTLVNLDGYTKAGAGDGVPTHPTAAGAGSDLYLDLDVLFSDMQTKDGDVFEVRVVDANNYVRSRAVLRSMAPTDTTLDLPRAVPRDDAPSRLDFYLDVNRSGGFDGLGNPQTSDHAWRIDPLQDTTDSAGSAGAVHVTFTRNDSYTDIDDWPAGTRNPAKDSGLSARVHVSGLGPHLGRLLQLNVLERDTGHTACVYRERKLGAPELDAVVPSCVERMTYDVEVLVDVDGNGATGDDGDIAVHTTNEVADAGLVTSVDVSTDGAAR
jgi:hypothetical protein